jgi:hypothetical protein
MIPFPENEEFNKFSNYKIFENEKMKNLITIALIAIIFSFNLKAEINEQRILLDLNGKKRFYSIYNG